MVMSRTGSRSRQQGALMIEVLITIVICVIGLWGLSTVQAKLQQSEVESYQRSQALMLLEDMASRLEINRRNAAAYATVTGTANPLGAGMSCPTTTATLLQRDRSEWCAALQGAAELSGTTRVGAMVGARGCIESIATNQYMLTVAWQGLTPLGSPPDSVDCGEGQYNKADTPCQNDLCRRYVTTIVRIGDLTP